MSKTFSFLKYYSIPARPEISSLVLGLIAVFAFAPFGFAPAMLIALAGFFALLNKAESIKSATKIGLWFGLGMFGLGTSWLFSSLYFYADTFLPVAVFLTFLFILYLSLFTIFAAGVFVWLRDKLQHLPFFFWALVVPSVWTLSELLRGSVLDGYPFILSGNSHILTWLDGYAPVLGVWGVSFAVALSASILLLMWMHARWLSGAVLLSALWLGGMQLQKVQWVQAVDKPVDVALIQGNIPQEEKWLVESFRPTLKTYVSLTKQNIDADLIVWPETALPAYFDVVEKGAVFGLIEDAKLMKKDILVGVIDGGRDSDKYYNALVNLKDSSQRYWKHHLVPFSEYFPFDSAFAFISGLLDIPYATFSAGDENQPPMLLGGQMAGLSICYEMAFGEELAIQLPEAKYLVTVSNDAWFAYTFEPAQQLQEVQMRARELGREIARATNTGYTAIVGIDGQVKVHIPAYEEGVLRGMVQPYDGLTPYAQWQRKPIILLVGLILIAGLLLARRKQGS